MATMWHKRVRTPGVVDAGRSMIGSNRCWAAPDEAAGSYASCRFPAACLPRSVTTS